MFFISTAHLDVWGEKGTTTGRMGLLTWDWILRPEGWRVHRRWMKYVSIFLSWAVWVLGSPGGAWKIGVIV